MKLKKLRGFSLIEMMIALIAIAVIAASVTPIVSKKITGEKLNLKTNLVNITTNCEEKFGPDCKLCEKTNRCLVCSKTCPVGTYLDTATCSCIACSTIDTNCNECVSGPQCTTCKPGYYLENNSCKICEAGYKCPTGINREVCPAGSYSVNKGNSSCTPCEIGTYQDREAQTACISCPRGSYTDTTGNRECTPCPSGYYCTGGSHKATCASKTANCVTCNPEDGTCMGCITGNKLSAASCIPCGVTGCTAYSNKCVCATCSAGYAVNNSGSCSTCQTANCVSYSTGCSCAKCNAGYYVLGGQCKMCEKGHVCQDGINRIACPSGTYMNQEGNSGSCIGCSKYTNIPYCIGGCDTTTGGCLQCIPYHLSHYANITLINGACYGYPEEPKHCPAGSIWIQDPNQMNFCAIRVNPEEHLTANITMLTPHSKLEGRICSTRDKEKCCWSGDTAIVGEDRTVCTVQAAVDICKNLKLGGLEWFLLDVSKLGVVKYAKKFDRFNTNQVKALDLCGRIGDSYKHDLKECYNGFINEREVRYCPSDYGYTCGVEALVILDDNRLITNSNNGIYFNYSSGNYPSIWYFSNHDINKSEEYSSYYNNVLLRKNPHYSSGQVVCVANKVPLF